MSAQEEFEVDALDGLNKEYMVLETRYASAIIDEAAELEATATDDLDAEGKEVRGLETRVAVSNYLLSAIEDSALKGAEKELEDALGIAGAGIQVPWVALLSQEAKVETRAATNAPADGTLTSANVLGRVFSWWCGKLSRRCISSRSSWNAKLSCSEFWCFACYTLRRVRMPTRQRQQSARMN